MTEVDALTYELEQERKAFDKLHKRHMKLLKQQGNLEKENEELKTLVNFYKYFQKDARELEKENEDLRKELEEITRFRFLGVLALTEDMHLVLIDDKKFNIFDLDFLKNLLND